MATPWNQATDDAYAEAKRRAEASQNYLKNTPGLGSVQVQALQNIIRENHGKMSDAVRERDRLAAGIQEEQAAWRASQTPAGPSQAEILRRMEEERKQAEINRALQAAKSFIANNGLEELWSGYEKYIRQGYTNMETVGTIVSNDKT